MDRSNLKNHILPTDSPELILYPIAISDTADKNLWLNGILLQKLKESKLIFAENERTIRRFISSLKTGVRIEDYQIFRLDKNTSATELMEYTQLIRKYGQALLMSEAGCPAVADPGSALVDACHKNLITVKPLVGPSSILLALMGSGLSGQSFSFHGYLPVDKNLCSSLIKKLEQESGRENRTQILIETPYRNAAIWKCLLTNLSPETRLCYAKDLSGSSEEIRQMTVAEWRKASAVTWVKMPVIFLFQK